MFPSFLLTFREVLEAVLVAGIVTTFLIRIGETARLRYVWLGIAAGVIAALTAAWGIHMTLGELPARIEEIAEGVLMLLAGALITSMIFWMLQQERVAEKIHAKIHAHISTGQAWGIALIVFLAVFREGTELAIFLFATDSLTAGDMLTGVATGMLAAVALGWAFFAGIARASLHTFFRVTNILLLLFAAGIIAHGVHELQEAGLISYGMTELFNIKAVLNDKEMPGNILRALFGYNDNPTLLESAVYIGYILPVGYFLFRRQN